MISHSLDIGKVSTDCKTAACVTAAISTMPSALANFISVSSAVSFDDKLNSMQLALKAGASQDFITFLSGSPSAVAVVKSLKDDANCFGDFCDGDIADTTRRIFEALDRHGVTGDRAVDLFAEAAVNHDFYIDLTNSESFAYTRKVLALGMSAEETAGFLREVMDSVSPMMHTTKYDGKDLDSVTRFPEFRCDARLSIEDERSSDSFDPIRDFKEFRGRGL